MRVIFEFFMPKFGMSSHPFNFQIYLITLARAENSDDSISQGKKEPVGEGGEGESPVCYMCFDDENTDDNPLIAPCKCRGDTRYVHVGCLRKWHTAEADNQICFLFSVDGFF